jgi:hypothetical protein
MSFDEEVTGACLDILYAGLLRIRHAADLDAARKEAYHLHNLPQLVRTRKRELLEYYLDVERPGFLREHPDNPETFGPAWERLERIRASVAK